MKSKNETRIKSLGDKLFLSFISLIIIVSVLVTGWELLGADGGIRSALGEIMANIPFSEEIVDVICNIIQYDYELPENSSSVVLDVIVDTIQLAFMTLLQPIVIGAIRLLVGLGKESRIINLLIAIVITPLLALIASNISTLMFNYFNDKWGYGIAVTLSIVCVLLLGLLSMFHLIRWWRLGPSFTYKRAFLWRFSDFGLRMAMMFIIDALCLALFVMIFLKNDTGVLLSVLSIIVVIFLADILKTSLQHAIVGNPESWKK